MDVDFRLDESETLPGVEDSGQSGMSNQTIYAPSITPGPQDPIGSILELAEGSGRVEYKRSCLWPSDTPVLQVQKVLMRLANANRNEGGYIQLGREDDGTILGLVNKELQPVSHRELQAAEQTLVEYAGRLDPPMHIRWFRHSQEGKDTIVIQVPGRPLGGWFQGEDGITYTGSASHPRIAKQSLLQQWALEAAASLDERVRHEEARPVLSATITGIATYDVSDNQAAPGSMRAVPGQLIVRVHHEAGKTGQSATAVATSSTGREIFLRPERGTTVRPTLDAAAHPDTQGIGGTVIPVAFRLPHEEFQPGSFWHISTYVKSTMGAWWRQDSDSFHLPPRSTSYPLDQEQRIEATLRDPIRVDGPPARNDQ